MLASEDRISVSAPGKVLLCGGYLIIDRLNKGLVLASTSRFFSSVSWEPAVQKARQNIDGISQYEIHVQSPQFHSSYGYYLTESTPHPADGDRQVQWQLRAAFDQLWHTPGGGVRIMNVTLQADNDFYSQAENLSMRGLPQTVQGLRCLPRFMPCPQRGGEVIIQKTGLGSSAALVTSLVGALLQFFGVVDLCNPGSEGTGSGVGTLQGEAGQRAVHNLAQACHALAQGKVGSGFDVSAAVYGSQAYRRFSPSVLEPILNSTTVADGSALTYRDLDPIILHQCVLDAAWDGECIPWGLPPGLILLLGDVSGGSSTPTMVREVMKWRSFEVSSKGSCMIWEALRVVNEHISRLFQLLAQQAAAHPEAYSEAVGLFAIKPPSKWEVQPGTYAGALSTEAAMCQLRAAFVEARAQLRAMGLAAGVAIEPEAQTELADATMEVTGVLCAGVPGAGGVDAIFAISLSEASAEAVMDMWSLWHERGCSNKLTSRVSPLLGGAATSVEHDSGRAGLRVEKPTCVPTLVKDIK